MAIKSLAAAKMSGVEGSSKSSTWHCPSEELLGSGLDIHLRRTEVNGANSCCLGAGCSFKGHTGAAPAGPAAFSTGDCPVGFSMPLVRYR